MRKGYVILSRFQNLRPEKEFALKFGAHDLAQSYLPERSCGAKSHHPGAFRLDPSPGAVFECGCGETWRIEIYNKLCSLSLEHHQPAIYSSTIVSQ